MKVASITQSKRMRHNYVNLMNRPMIKRMKMTEFQFKTKKRKIEKMFGLKNEYLDQAKKNGA